MQGVAYVYEIVPPVRSVNEFIRPLTVFAKLPCSIPNVMFFPSGKLTCVMGYTVGIVVPFDVQGVMAISLAIPAPTVAEIC